MKAKLIIGASIILYSFYTISCSKENIANSGANATSLDAQYSTVTLSVCDQFAYTDTIFYPAELPNDYIVHPVNALPGTFGAFPDELHIDKTTGDIDITESETGLKYMVWYVATGSTDTCKKFITVSGINFTDSIYVLKNNMAVATPMYNSTPLLATDCNGYCEFDDGPDDDDGDGTADEPIAGQEVIPQGISMDKTTGKIDLKKSLKNGALGINPQNGAFKDFVLNYRISDASSNALNKISFRVYYYKSQSKIPGRLLDTLAAKQSQIILNDDKHSPATIPYTVNNLLTNKGGVGEVKCRPPYIIIVQQ